MSHRRFNHPPIPTPYEAAPHDVVAAAAHHVANVVQNAQDPRPPQQEGIVFAATTPPNPESLPTDRIINPRLATAIGARLIERTFPDVELPSLRDYTPSRATPSVPRTGQDPHLPSSRPKPTRVEITPRDAWYGAGTTAAEAAEPRHPVDASRDPQYLPPSARHPKRERQKKRDNDAAKHEKETQNEAYDRQITELIDLFNEHKKTKGFSPVEIIGRRRLFRRDPTSEHDIYPDIAPTEAAGLWRRHLRYRTVEGIRAKTPRFIHNRLGTAHPRHDVNDVVYGIPVSRRFSVERTNTRSFSDPVSEHKDVMFTMDGMVYQRFVDTTGGDGFSAIGDHGVAFNAVDGQGNPQVSPRQKQLIINHLRQRLLEAGVPMIDSRHAN